MMIKSANNITTSNILAGGIDTIGVIFSTILSFLITVACSVSDYTQISVLMDSVQNESVFTIVFASITICIFLNFSLYIAGTVIKRMSCGKPLGGSVTISILSIILSFLLFAAVFTLTFKFKYELKDYLFTLNQSEKIDSVINKAVEAGADVVNDLTGNSTSDYDIIRISAILSGLMPAFTSILSLLSVFMFYDPIASDKALIQFKLMFYKYRYYVTKASLEAVEREIIRLEQLPSTYRDLLMRDYRNYLIYCSETESAEMTARAAEYTAAIELFKEDQDTVTRLSCEAKKIKLDERLSSHYQINDDDIPKVLLNQIENTNNLFNKQKSSDNILSLYNIEDTITAPKSSESFDTISETTDSDDNPQYRDIDDDIPTFSSTSIENLCSVNIPDSMVSPQLKQAVNH